MKKGLIFFLIKYQRRVPIKMSMKFKEILTHHHDGSLEVKETVRIKCIGSETIVMPGRKLDKRFLTEAVAELGKSQVFHQN